MREQLLRDPTVIPSSSLPPVVLPIGMSSERQWYLYDKIRQFCPDECKDLTCPYPSCARPATSSSRRSTPEAEQVGSLRSCSLMTDDSVMREQLLRDPTVIPSSSLPPVVLPIGMSSERQWYLYDKIRQFCPDECKDLTCPYPSCARPATSSSRRSTPEAEQVREPAEEVEVPVSSTKRVRTCKNWS